MDEVLTEDQQLLLEGSSRFMEESFPLAAVRRLSSEGGDPPPSYRLQSAELGWYAMLVPESLGGGSVSGNGVVDAALIAYRRGRALQPGAFVPTNVVALALAVAGSSEQQDKVLPALISGQAAGAWLGLDYDDPARSVLQARSSPTGYRLSGGPIPVQEFEADSWLLLTVDHEGGLSQFLLEPGLPGVTIATRQSLDLSRRTSLVGIDDIEVAPSALVGAPGEARPVVAEQLAVACVLTAAESVGAMDRDFQTALQYAKDRTAFGRPIGSFQAVKHQLADTSLLLEMSKAAVLAAATSLGEGDEHGLQAASMAKALVAEHSGELAQNCFQVFGGIGFTWEHDQHLFLRRMMSDAAMYGGAAWHREHICQLAGL